MNIVITMGGLGSRFQKAGYTVPKYQIEVKGKTLFEWSIISLSDFVNPSNKFIFMVKQSDNARLFIENQLKQLSIINYDIVEIDHLTDGQATTALLASKVWNIDDELIIYNIDTYVEANVLKLSSIKGDGFIPCFIAEGDHWSFVKVNQDFQALEVKEKVRISDYCTLGLYYFKSAKLYEEVYYDFYVKQTQTIKERYVAPMYEYMIEQNKEVYIEVIDYKKVHALGTPEELDAFKLEF